METLQANQRQETEVNAVTLAYTAGLLDGEGNLSIGQRADGEFYSRFAIYNTHLKTLKWLKVQFKVGWVGRGSGNGCYAWVVSSKQAEPLLSALLPYLRIKKRQAKTWLTFRRTFNGTPLTKGKIKLRQALVAKLRALIHKNKCVSSIQPQMTNRKDVESVPQSDSPTPRETVD